MRSDEYLRSLKEWSHGISYKLCGIEVMFFCNEIRELKDGLQLSALLAK
jgi:hypothetical protein